LCFDASRLARNGREWHHLLELCGLVEARVIDLDGVYDPCRPNDRLLHDMKGSMSEFELGVLRARMLDATRGKARRGELWISVPTPGSRSIMRCTHQGRWCFGKTPMQTFIDTLPRAKEKSLQPA
jgi:DNA invertase Pin-like site-specific DNA recombinase